MPKYAKNGWGQIKRALKKVKLAIIDTKKWQKCHLKCLWTTDDKSCWYVAAILCDDVQMAMNAVCLCSWYGGEL